MKKNIKTESIMNILDELYPTPAIPLHHHNHYTLLIAVLLSAHTTDKAVNNVTPQLFAMADTPEKMVEIPLEKIEKTIRSCGLAPRKAKNILELSQILIEKHQGKVPKSFEELEALPGVGH